MFSSLYNAVAHTRYTQYVGRVATDGANLHAGKAIAHTAGGKTAENAIAADFLQRALRHRVGAAARVCVSLSLSLFLSLKYAIKGETISYLRVSCIGALFWHTAHSKRGRGGNARSPGRLLLGGLPTSNIPAPGG